MHILISNTPINKKEANDTTKMHGNPAMLFQFLIGFLFLIASPLAAQQQLELKLNRITEELKTRSLLTVYDHPVDESSYKNVPKGMQKSLITRFDIDRPQSAYERLMIDQNDTAAWNKYVNLFEIDTAYISKEKLKNSYISIFSGIDSLDQKIMMFDLNGNRDFADDKTYIIPKSRLVDTTLSMDIPFQRFHRDGVTDSLILVGVFPKALSQESGNTIDRDLGLDLYNRTNFVGRYKGAAFDHELYFSPPLLENLYHGHPSAQVYHLQILDPANTIVQSKMLRMIDTVYFDRAEWHIIGDHLDREKLTFEKVRDAPEGYQLGQLFAGLPPMSDFYSAQDIDLPSDKLLLIDFWGTWCQPCIASIPALTEFYHRNKDKINLISVLYDSTEKVEDAKKIIAEHSMDWTHVFDNRENSQWVKPMGVQTFPGFILVGRGNSILINNHVGFDELEKMIAEQ